MVANNGYFKGKVEADEGYFSGEIKTATSYADYFSTTMEYTGITCKNNLFASSTKYSARGMEIFDSDEQSVGFFGVITTGNPYIDVEGSTLSSKFARITATNLSVSGTKSRLASTEDYGERLLYCYETPSPTFGDVGEGKIDETGKCYVFLDDLFAETIDTDCTYQVFLQAYGNGTCYVTERNTNYFVVEGTGNLSFGWEVKAIQKGYDTMRLEEPLEDTVETDYAQETYAYLKTLLYNVESEVFQYEKH